MTHQNKKTNILSKEAILAVEDSSIRLVEVPEWNGSVYIRVLNGIEREKLETLIARFDKDKEKKEYYGGILATLSICDENGNRLFTEEEVDSLAKKSGVALGRIIKQIMELNNLLPTVNLEAKEKAVKN